MLTGILTAQNYANEHEVGQAINDGNFNREDIFVTTKTLTSPFASGYMDIFNNQVH